MQKIEQKLEKRAKIDNRMQKLCQECDEILPKESIRLRDLIKRNNVDIFKLDKIYNLFDEEEKKYLEFVNINVKYEGYIKQQQEEIEKMLANENIVIPDDFEYTNLKGLRMEAIEKLAKIRPISIGQASRISGVSPADVSVLLIYVKKYKKNR